MKRLLHVSLQVKILGLIITLILLIISLITTTFVMMESKEDIYKAKSLALQTAKTLSYMPVIQRAASSGHITGEANSVVDQVREEINASGILIEKQNKLLYTNASQRIQEQLSNGEETYRARVFGSAYAMDSGQNKNALLLGISPIFIDYGSYGKIEGTVTVVLQMAAIKEEIAADTRKILMVSFVVLIAGILGGVLLTRSIRKDTLGLEPIEIASLYRERNAILQSIKEGILAIDSDEKITMMNNYAKQVLDIKIDTKGLALAEVFKSSRMIHLLRSRHENKNEEIQYNGRIIIVNSQPIVEGNKKIGMVASFRDKTEIKKMVNTLSEVKQYSEDLRAQAHEFTNKLYVLLGLIQLGKVDEAIALIQEETKTQEMNTDIIFNHLQDEKIQAILLGKLAKASETKIEFTISPDTSVSQLPDHFELIPLLIIISNLIDNAFEAASKVKDGQVSFFATDIGNDIIFEVADNGNGIEEAGIPSLFKKGFSGKGENRGYGLFNVKYEIDQLSGSIELQTSAEGTIFTVFLPKGEPL